MAKYVVLKINGKQYKAEEGQEILVDKILAEKPVAEVLLLVDGEKVEIGKPTLNNSKLKIKVLEKQVKGEKIRVLKYKAKSRYRKRTGFRPVYTKLLLEKI